MRIFTSLTLLHIAILFHMTNMFKPGRMLRENRHAVFFAFLLFIVFPFLYFPVTPDPELHVRYATLSLVMLILSVYLVFKMDHQAQDLFMAAGNSVLAFLMYFMVCLVSLFKSFNPGDGLYEVSNIFLMALLFFWLVYAFRKSDRAFEILPVSISIAVLIFSTAGFVQFLPSLEQAWSENKPLYLQRWLTSVFASKNFYAETVFLCMPFSIYGSMFLKNGPRVLCLLALLLEMVSVVILASVAVWIASAVMLVFIFIFLLIYRRKMGRSFISVKRKTLTGVLLVALLMMAGLFLLSRKPVFKDTFIPLSQKLHAAYYYLEKDSSVFIDDEMNANSLFERLLLIRNSLRMGRDNPITGCGTGNWKILFPKYGVEGTSYLSQGNLRFEHPHNDYLLVWCETGVPGLLCWLGIFIFTFYNGIRVLRHATSGQTVFLMVLMMAGIAGFMTISFFSYPKERFYSILMLILMCAIPASWKPAGVHPPPFTRKILVLLLPVLCSMVLWIQMMHYKGELYMKKALDYQHRKNFPAMQNSLKRAHSFFFTLDHYSTPVNWYLGLAAFYSGDTARAFKCFHSALEHNPWHVQSLNDLATLHEKKGQPGQAIELYKRVLHISPRNQQAILNMSAAYFNEGKMEEAFQTIRQFPGSKSDQKYRTSLHAILFAMANRYVQVNSDTLLADYLSRQISKNSRYLLHLYDSTGSEEMGLDWLSKELRQERE